MTNIAMDTTTQEQLSTIEPVQVPSGAVLYPCSARLVSCELIPCVYFIEASQFKYVFAESLPPQDSIISASDIAAIDESAYRLPARYASNIYQHGESGFGYYLFRLTFSWWARRDYLVGGFVDFLRYPWSYTGRNVRQLEFYNIDRERVLKRQVMTESPAVPFKWCVF